MNFTKYRSLTDKELLDKMHSSRGHSEVIEELCQRLEAFMLHEEKQDENLREKAECPICEASLFVKQDDESYRLEIFCNVNP